MNDTSVTLLERIRLGDLLSPLFSIEIPDKRNFTLRFVPSTKSRLIGRDIASTDISVYEVVNL